MVTDLDKSTLATKPPRPPPPSFHSPTSSMTNPVIDVIFVLSYQYKIPQQAIILPHISFATLDHDLYLPMKTSL